MSYKLCWSFFVFFFFLSFRQLDKKQTQVISGRAIFNFKMFPKFIFQRSANLLHVFSRSPGGSGDSDMDAGLMWRRRKVTGTTYAGSIRRINEAQPADVTDLDTTAASTSRGHQPYRSPIIHSVDRCYDAGL